MMVQIQWFGLIWAFAVLLCLAMAGLLVLAARKVKRQGRPKVASRLTLAALIEGALVALDLVVRVGVSTLSERSLDNWVLDLWTLVRPTGHAVVLLLVVMAVRGLLAAERSKGRQA